MSKNVLSGHLISSSEAWEAMAQELSSITHDEVWIVSAYLKEAALMKFASFVHSSNSVSILARWQGADLISGSSDLQAYDVAKENNWRFSVRQDLHAKVYRINHTSIYLGSANLTSSGFPTNGGVGNAEMMVRVDASDLNITAISSLFDHSVLVDDSLMASLRQWVEIEKSLSTRFEVHSGNEFPLDALQRDMLHGHVKQLMLADCFLALPRDVQEAASQPPNTAPSDVQHDLSLLGCSTLPNLPNISNRLGQLFQQSRLFRWLYGEVVASESQQIFFGDLCSRLHDALIEDPKPFRTDVKTLLATLLRWIEYYSECGLSVDRPRYSERVFADVTRKTTTPRFE